MVAGVSLAGIVLTWRGAFLGLALHYLGIAIVLVTMSGFAAGVAALITAVGIEALIAADQNISLRDGAWLLHPFDGLRTSAGDPLIRDRIRRRLRRRDVLTGEASVRWFDLSVIALAVVGALGVAIGGQHFAGFADDAIVGVLILCGLLYCLLGELSRLTSGLLFLGSAANILLHETGPSLAPAETLLMSVGEVALALALAYLGAREGRLSDGADRTAAVPSEPLDSVETTIVAADPGGTS